MSKSAIAALVGLISLLVGATFHVEISQDLQLNIVELIAGAVSIVPIIYHLFKDRKPKDPSA